MSENILKMSLQKVITSVLVKEILADYESDSEVVGHLVVTVAEKPKKKRNCIKNYEDVVATYNLSEFQAHFRLKKTTFASLLNIMGPALETQSCDDRGGRPTHSADKQLMVSLWMLANQESYRCVADRFNISSISTAWEYFHKVVDFVIKNAHEYIKWPKSHAEVEVIINDFQKRAGIAGVIRAIDGSHIPITQPHHIPNSYINRNKYYSIVLQAVCTAQYMFIDCFAGCPGSIHDARVLRMSPLSNALNNNLISNVLHLLGDSAYPNTVNIITPYKDNGHLSRKQKVFNYLHSSTRVCIEQTFGLLKGRFRILRHVNIYRTDLIPKVIITCCAFHNICMSMHDNDVQDIGMETETEETFVEETLNGTDGIAKRNRLCNAIEL